jgi:serine/threonine-protein phosphatase 2A activator
MYFSYHQAEVLGKRVVVQHLPLGGLLEWNVIGAPPTMTALPQSHVCTATPVPWGSSRASISEGSSAEPSLS